MGFFSIFKKKKSKNNFEIEEFEKNDFLGKAAEAGHKAKEAIKDKQYDQAWELFHKQKAFYMQHANWSRFTAHQTLNLDASVHENMANVLRLENKHQDALVHIVYWVLAGAERPIKKHQQKFKSYFDRCEFKNTEFTGAEKTIAANTKLPEFTLAGSIVSKWVSDE